MIHHLKHWLLVPKLIIITAENTNVNNWKQCANKEVN